MVRAGRSGQHPLSAFEHIQVLSATNAWAVGTAPDATDTGSVVAAVNWNGKELSNDAAIAALSPTDVYVAQLGGMSHFNGTAWTTTSIPSGVNVLTAHAVVSPGHVWFAGYYYPSNAVTAPAVLSTTSG
jgi:hypothetical protein